MEKLYEYTILYNHTDTLLLAEIMMVYKKVIQDNCQMDINYFLGIPGNLLYSFVIPDGRIVERPRVLSVCY